MNASRNPTVTTPVTGPLRMIGAGLLWLAVIAALFLAYQLWGTGRFTARAQAELSEQFAALEAAQPIPTDPIPTDPIPTDPIPTDRPEASVPEPSIVAEAPLGTAPVAGHQPMPGDVVGRVLIPSIDLDWFVVEGVDDADLRSGPGRYPTTAPLGGAGNSAIAGHRTTYGAPFGRLDELRPGDEITTITPFGEARYEVVEPDQALAGWVQDLNAIAPGHAIVGSGATFVLSDMGDDRLTLTACHPRFSARERIVVVARLIGFAHTTPTAPSLDPSAVPLPDPTTGPSGDPDPTPAEAGPAQEPPPAPIDTARAVLDPPQDLGLRGYDQALAPAVVLGLTTLVMSAAAAVLSMRVGRGRAAVVSAVPLGVSMWYFFVFLDRLLPAY